MVIQLTKSYLESQEISTLDLFSRIIENEKFFPRIVDIKKYISLVDPYQSALGAAQKYGSWNSVYFFDDRISQTILAGWGSWTGFCLSTDRNRSDRFRAVYDTTANSADPRRGILYGDPGEETFAIEDGKKIDKNSVKLNFCIDKKIRKDYPVYGLPVLIPETPESDKMVDPEKLKRFKEKFYAIKRPD